MTLKGFKASLFTQEKERTRQGGRLSATICNIGMKCVLRAYDMEGTTRQKLVQVLKKLKRSKRVLVMILSEVHKRRLEINWKKTKYMEVSRSEMES